MRDNPSHSSEDACQAPLVFVTGTQRCGTTLVCRILDAHPELSMSNEILTPDELDAVFAKEDPARSLGAVLQWKQAPLRSSLWGHKQPYLTYHLETLYQRFPGSKIVIVMRDGRAVASSYLKVKWGTANIYAAAQRWRSEVELQKDFLRKHTDTACLLHYESLLTDPESSIQKLCSFLGLEYDPSMLEFYKQPASFKQHRNNRNTSRAIDPNLMDTWRERLTSHQVRVFEAVAGETLREHGYGLQYEGYTIPSPLRWWYELHQKIVGELQIQYKWRFS